ncbi:cupin domain-containing protein [Streptomyces marincola]|uniref:cupin domain-containing protein n=1 Tax=Streptomyces marincola TaxID=2878388 RepID=UPI0034CEAD4C
MRGAFLLKSVFDPPWGLRIKDRAALSLVTISHGSAWVPREGSEPVRVTAGDVAVTRCPSRTRSPTTRRRLPASPSPRNSVAAPPPRGGMSPSRCPWACAPGGNPQRAGSTVLLSGT